MKALLVVIVMWTSGTGYGSVGSVEADTYPYNDAARCVADAEAINLQKVSGGRRWSARGWWIEAVCLELPS